MKKVKKNLLFVIIGVILTLLLGVAIYFLIKSRQENRLTLEENKWIDSNKYNVIDVGVMNDVPILSYEGNGIIYSYLDYITDKYSLNFNVTSYKLDGEIKYEYRTDIVNSVTSNDIVLLEDNMVFLTSNGAEYSSINEVSNLKIGILSKDKELLLPYLENNNIKFVEYNTYSELKNALVNKANESAEAVDGIIILKTIFMKEMVENNFKISFDFDNIKQFFVLTREGSSQLNSILKKAYDVWSKENYRSEYNNNLLNNYFLFKGITDSEQKRLKSKSYVYGFIDYGIYNYLKNNKISGLSSLVLRDFNDVTGISITYTRYNNISKLLKDFNSKKVDFSLNINGDFDYTNEVYNTVGAFDKKVVIISGIDNSDIIKNIYSLSSKEVLTIKDSYLEKYLLSNNVKVKSYNNMKDLSKYFNDNDIAILDLENYNFYKTSSFKNGKVNYISSDINGKYNYVVNSTDDNKIFKELFSFYIDFCSMDNLISSNYNLIAYENINMVYILLIIIAILCIYVFSDFSRHIKIMFGKAKENRKVHLTKEEKIKYIDQLTSLKNRTYLNSRIESWDDSQVYPQAIIIIDLNNIAYINDNYGREEGDKVITEAANILIINQMHNSEIIRTDGNEFLIYLVGYTEKQIISYLRKLNRELKNLSHGFGAASGYSIILDAIKTIDDAVNEATIEMKNNKEDIDY